MPFQAGDPAPDFTLPVTGGGTKRLSDYDGRNLVLFLYPRDDTSGCTREAREFSAAQADFGHCRTDILGLSKDSIASHEKFIAKHDLTVPLASDAETDLCERIGAWIEKSMYGRKFWGIQRTTLLIDSTQKISRRWDKVKVDGHVAEVLQSVRAMEE